MRGAWGLDPMGGCVLPALAPPSCPALLRRRARRRRPPPYDARLRRPPLPPPAAPPAAGALLHTTPASAAPVAVTRDLDADGHLDAIDLTSRSAAGLRVSGYRTAGPARGIGHGVRVALREHQTADTGARPRILLGGR